MSSFHDLPPEMVEQIVEFLPFAEVHAGLIQARLNRVSQATREVTRRAMIRSRWKPVLPFERDLILVACCQAIREGEIPGVTDCDVPLDCVLPGGYPFGEHVWRRRRTFFCDPDADQRLLNAGFVRVRTVVRGERASRSIVNRTKALWSIWILSSLILAGLCFRLILT